MNNSNLIVEKNSDNRREDVKKCVNKREKCNKPYQQNVHHFTHTTKIQQQQHLNEITRPEYQKT